MTDFSKDEWRVTEHTPNTVITPYGRISVSWTSNCDESVNRRAEDMAKVIAKIPEMLQIIDKVNMLHFLFPEDQS